MFLFKKNHLFDLHLGSLLTVHIMGLQLRLLFASIHYLEKDGSSMAPVTFITLFELCVHCLLCQKFVAYSLKKIYISELHIVSLYITVSAQHIFTECRLCSGHCYGCWKYIPGYTIKSLPSWCLYLVGGVIRGGEKSKIGIRG